MSRPDNLGIVCAIVVGVIMIATVIFPPLVLTPPSQILPEKVSIVVLIFGSLLVGCATVWQSVIIGRDRLEIITKRIRDSFDETRLAFRTFLSGGWGIFFRRCER
jgi:hypothetical protein